MDIYMYKFRNNLKSIAKKNNYDLQTSMGEINERISFPKAS